LFSVLWSLAKFMVRVAFRFLVEFGRLGNAHVNMGQAGAYTNLNPGKQTNGYTEYFPKCYE